MATATRTREVRFLYKCARCKAVRGVVYERRITRHEPPFSCPYSTSTDWTTENQRREYTNVVCACGQYMQGREVRGRYSESRKCDVRCTGAKGHDCECQCGGVNHGRDHDVLTGGIH